MSDCCNCFIVFVISICYVQGKYQLWRGIFSRVQSFLLANALPSSIRFSCQYNGSFMALFISILMALSFLCFSGEIDLVGRVFEEEGDFLGVIGTF